MTNSTTTELLAERYRFILSQIAASNNMTATLLNFYYGAIAAIITGVAIAIAQVTQHIALRPILTMSLRGMILAVAILSGFVIMQMVAHLFSWFDLRNEEVEVLVSSGIARAKPRWRNAWRWAETYLLGLVILSGCFAISYLSRCIDLVDQLR